jgi:hypothetical protein
VAIFALSFLISGNKKTFQIYFYFEFRFLAKFPEGKRKRKGRVILSHKNPNVVHGCFLSLHKSIGFLVTKIAILPLVCAMVGAWHECRNAT